MMAIDDVDKEVNELFKKHIFGWLESFPLNKARAELMADALEETAEALRGLPHQTKNYENLKQKLKEGEDDG